jgi:hypothetical protein
MSWNPVFRAEKTNEKKNRTVHFEVSYVMGGTPKSSIFIVIFHENRAVHVQKPRPQTRAAARQRLDDVPGSDGKVGEKAETNSATRKKYVQGTSCDEKMP